MKLNNKKTLTLNKEEATALIKAAEILEQIVNLSDDNFILVEPESENEFSDAILWECYNVINDLIINYGSDGKNTITLDFKDEEN